jgi:hypothetical protein
MKKILLVLCAWLSFASQGAVYHPEVLSHVERAVEKAVAKGELPTVVFDIDDTLINTSYRTGRILTELSRDSKFARAYPAEARALRDISVSRLHYDVGDTLRHLGFSNPSMIEMAKAFWAPRFYSSEYVEDDRVVTGARAFVTSLHGRGADIVYLTGRPRPDMGEGTVHNLRARGLPLNTERTTLLMKPEKDMDDLEYKRGALESIHECHGEVVAVFENEPANLNMLGDAFPGATRVFVDTIHSSKPDIPTLESQWIRDFRREE